MNKLYSIGFAAIVVAFLFAPGVIVAPSESGSVPFPVDEQQLIARQVRANWAVAISRFSPKLMQSACAVLLCCSGSLSVYLIVLMLDYWRRGRLNQRARSVLAQDHAFPLSIEAVGYFERRHNAVIRRVLFPLFAVLLGLIPPLCVLGWWSSGRAWTLLSVMPWLRLTGVMGWLQDHLSAGWMDAICLVALHIVCTGVAVWLSRTLLQSSGADWRAPWAYEMLLTGVAEIKNDPELVKGINSLWTIDPLHIVSFVFKFFASTSHVSSFPTITAAAVSPVRAIGPSSCPGRVNDP